MIYSCCNENRKAAILSNPALNLNGIDYLEVLDQEAIALNSPRQQTLLVHCLNGNNIGNSPPALTPSNVIIGGGESITNVGVVWIALASAPPPQANALEQAYFSKLPNAGNILVVRTDKAGDFSAYAFRLVNVASQAAEDPFDVTEVLTGFDSQLAEVPFSFKVECGGNFDCQTQTANCAPPAATPPAINYLAKDYGSFRQIMLDRLSQLLPDWNPSTEADFGVALAELIAYVGDNLSYQQDAIATEAYLETARSRVSLRRHALLVDYHVHDGCNARAWIHLEVAGNPGDQISLTRATTRFYAPAPGMPSGLQVGSNNEQAALLAGVVIFEPMHDATLYPAHNQMSFYTWGDTNCCLPAGATEATLAGSYPNLQPGDVLIFQEMKGPQTGQSADADMRHRCAVRLTQVATQSADGKPLVDPLFLDASGNPTAVTEIQWSEEDALPFPICISSQYLDDENGLQTVSDVNAVFGNVLLADQGVTMSAVPLPTVPGPRLFYPAGSSANRCKPGQPTPVPVRYRPLVPTTVPGVPLTQAVQLPVAGIPVTPGITMLTGTGFVSLYDSANLTSLMIQAASPLTWPRWFGILAKPNSSNPGNFDLSVQYLPPGGATGVSGPVILESFTNLSFKVSDPNYVARQINQVSKLISVPSSYTPPAPAPAGFPAAATMLPNSGPVNLLDTTNKPYLTLGPTPPGAWPQYFGVVSQNLQQDPPAFRLVVVYNPSSGGLSINLPVTVEQFSGAALPTEAQELASNSNLIAVITFAQTPNPSLSASALMDFDPADALPVITLSGNADEVTTEWTPESDLLESGSSDPVFVVEVESDGTARLRFGDNTNGKTPVEDTAFVATYRLGNGTSGNVGADSLICLATNDARIQSCRNPLPATGGTDPETADEIRRRAPRAFLKQERAVTTTDYEQTAEANSQVDSAVASLRWTGSWYTVFIAVEPDGGGSLTPALQQTLETSEERYRLAGQELLLQSPQYVSIDIALQVCVDPNYFQAYVEQALQQVLGSGILPDGTKGLFYPDNFTFGQTVYLSPIYKAARSVPGVVSVTATKFQPQGVNTSQYLTAGEIKLTSLQVARLDNDPNFPDHGRLTLVVQGGK